MKQILSILLGLLFISSASFAVGAWLYPYYGDSGHMTEVGCSSEYQCIDDGSTLSTSDYIYHNYFSPGNVSVLYPLTNLPSEAASINYVRIYYDAASKPIWFRYGSGYAYLQKRRITPAMYASGSYYVDSYNYILTPLNDFSWDSYSSRKYFEDPTTGSDWTVGDVNLMKAGFNLASNEDGPAIARMRVYVSYNTD